MLDDERELQILEKEKTKIGAVAYRTEETEGDISIMDQPIVLPLQSLAFAVVAAHVIQFLPRQG